MTESREPSLRRAAQQLFLRAAGREEQISAEAPAESVPQRPAAPSLSERARALHEGGVVPVREIARLVGVSERTIYKYAQKGGWARRYKGNPRGAGGRFVPAEEAGKPHSSGLKALDPAGADQAAARCMRAGEISAAAAATARAAAERRAGRIKAEREVRTLERTFKSLLHMRADLVAVHSAGGPHAAQAARMAESVERIILSTAHRTLDAMEARALRRCDDAEAGPGIPEPVSAAPDLPRWLEET